MSNHWLLVWNDYLIQNNTALKFANSRIPVWVRMCRFSKDGRSNLFPQTSHGSQVLSLFLLTGFSEKSGLLLVISDSVESVGLLDVFKLLLRLEIGVSLLEFKLLSWLELGISVVSDFTWKEKQIILMHCIQNRNIIKNNRESSM
jgi:hypothetical protein